MSNKNTTTFIQKIARCVLFFPSLINIKDQILDVIKTEVRNRVRKFIIIAALLQLIACMLVILWFIILTMLAIYIYSIPMPLWSVVLCILFLNITALGLIAVFMLKIKQNLLFPSIQAQIQHFKSHSSTK